MKFTVAIILLLVTFYSFAEEVSNTNAIEGSKVRIGSSAFALTGGKTNGPLPSEAVVQLDEKRNVVYKLPDFFTYTFTCLTVLISIVTLVFGGLVAVNIVSANRTISLAQAELNRLKEGRKVAETEIGTLKTQFIQYLTVKSEEVKVHTEKVMNDTIQNQYEKVVIQKVKKELFEELSGATPTHTKVYTQLTEILQYPDAMSLKIYTLCLQKCSDNAEIRTKATEGLIICASLFTAEQASPKPKLATTT